MGQAHWNGCVVIPGREVHRGPDHVVELFLPGGSCFRFIAHPLGSLALRPEGYFRDIHGIEIENGMWSIDEDKVRAVTRQQDLLLLHNSDAHTLSDIGRHYNDLSVEQLEEAVRRKSQAR